MSGQIITDEDVRVEVLTTLADRKAEFDVQAIVSEIQATYGTVHIDVIDGESYWDLVQRHAL